MKTKFYLFIAIVIVTSAGIKAQTTNYDANGRFIGAPIVSLDPFVVDFTSWLDTDLPANPGSANYIEKDMIAYRKCFIQNGAVSTAGNIAPPNIVFPTFANGIDSIKVQFTNSTASIYLHYWKATLTTPGFSFKATLGPAFAPSTTVTYTVNDNLQLGLLQRGGIFTKIQRITIYPKPFYDTTGKFTGTPIVSTEPFVVDFSSWLDTDLPANPGSTTYIEKDMIALRKCFIQNGTVCTAGNVAPPNIVFPTFAKGIDSIKVQFMNSTASIYLHYWNATLPTPSFGWKSTLGPAVAPSTTVTYTVNADLQLGLLQRGGTLTKIQRITIYPKYFTDSDYVMMRKNLVEKIFVGSNYDLTNSSVRAAISSTAADANSFWPSMVKSPTTYLWSDLQSLINDPTLSPVNVSESYLRLQTMAKAYYIPTSPLYHNSALLSDIITALNFLNNYAYNKNTNTVGNWWNWDINTPTIYSSIIGILYDDLPATVIGNYYTTIMSFAYSRLNNPLNNFGNLASSCKIMLYCGVITKNATLLEQGLNRLVDVFVDNTTLTQRKDGQAAFEQLWTSQGDYHPFFERLTYKDGLYTDGTFLQHMTTPYIGGYGQTVVESSSQYVTVFDGVNMPFSQSLKDAVSVWIEKAYMPAIYNGEFMVMFCGRTNTGVVSKARSVVLDVAGSVCLIPDVQKQKEILSWCKSALAYDKYRGVDPLIDFQRVDKLVNDSTITTTFTPSYNLVQSAGDRVVHNRSDYRFGIAMSSSRIGKYEVIFNSNNSGWYMGDGMTYIYNEDNPTHYDYYMSGINKYRLAGTTVDVITRTPVSTFGNFPLCGTPTNAKDWVGGTSLRGLYGTAGMYLVGEVSSLEAKKSWFMFDNEVVALGAGITMTESRAAETIIEARNSVKQLTVDGVAKSSAASWSEVLTSPKWAYLQGTGGYYFPENSTINAQRSSNYTYLYIYHGVKPTNASYSYVLLPSATLAKTQSYANNPEVTILSNTNNLQAVYQSTLKILGVNFWGAGQIDIVKSMSAASVMLQRSNDSIFLSISDPTWKLNTIQLVLTGSYEMLSNSNGDAIMSTGTNPNIYFNTRDKMGQSINIVLRDKMVLSKMNYTALSDHSIGKPSLMQGVIKNEVFIKNVPTGQSTIHVTDMLGRQVYATSTKNTANIHFTIPALPAGVYLVRSITNNQQQFSWKIFL